MLAATASVQIQMLRSAMQGGLGAKDTIQKIHYWNVARASTHETVEVRVCIVESSLQGECGV